MSKKTAIVTDSNSGITQSESKKLGIFTLPMPFLINGETFYEDISLTQEEFYAKLTEGADISTSQPLVGSVIDMWDDILKEYDELVHIPMSSGLSGSCETAIGLSGDYDGRVVVINNQRISVTQRQAVMDAAALANAGKSAAEIKDILEKEKFESSIYIMLDTLKYLKKGGRVTPAAAAVATVLHIRPVLQIQGEKLDAFAKARSEKQGRSIMTDAIRKDIETRFGGMDNVRVFVAYTEDRERADDFCEQIKAELGCEVSYCDPLSLSVSCHIGPGALAVAASRKIDRYL